MPLRSQTISFQASGQFSGLFSDYVSGKETLLRYYSFAPGLDGYTNAIAAMKFAEENRSRLVEALKAQYTDAGLEIPAPLIEKLALNDTLTITTGHQLCLLTGPLYFIFKISTAIQLAAKLEAETGRKIVPVYWMASEDHDFDEIASVNLYGKTISWEKPAGGAVGRLKTDSLPGFLSEVKAVMGESDRANELFRLVSEAYRPGRTLAQATRELVHRIFDGKVLVLDGDDVSLKRSFIPFFKKDIFEQEPFALVQETIAQLQQLGYEAQVNPRPVNTFYLGENSRERIEGQAGRFEVLNTQLQFTVAELEQELEQHPERFSPNVVLRPVYQQFILPNLAYVGGPGELAYWLEFKPMFEKLGVYFPVLQPRNFALLVDAGAEERMKKLGIEAAQLFGEIEELVKHFVAEHAGESISLDAEKENIRAAFAAVIAKAEASDPTLKKAAEAELAKALNSIDTLSGKMMRAEKQKQESAVNQLRKLHAKFFPNGILQERYENFIPAFLSSGPDFTAEIASAFEWPVSGIQLLFPANS